MGRIKNDISNKCLSILRQYVNESDSNHNNKESALLALHQLQQITGGKNSDPNDIPVVTDPNKEPEPETLLDSTCIGRPRADGTPGGSG